MDVLRQVRPSVLYIAADGPRPNKPGEAEACKETRQEADQVDWPCRVEKLYREENRGIRHGIPEAITWFLEQEGRGIILEDDCLPAVDFFPFASALLDYYEDDSRVMHINGSNFQPFEPTSGSPSYYFSRYNHGWGWATWKRAWDTFDLEMHNLESFLSQARAITFWDSPKEEIYWKKVLTQTQKGEIATWDYQWNFALWNHNGLAVTPFVNLISYMGFGDGATNTTHATGGAQEIPHGTIGQLLHPMSIERNKTLDQKNFFRMYWGSPKERLIAKLRKLRKVLFPL